MNVELVAQMFKNYQSNVLFHLEGMFLSSMVLESCLLCCSHGEFQGAILEASSMTNAMITSKYAKNNTIQLLSR